ncbi:putative RNA-binding protein Luc7-like 1 isoform X2 [Myxocyprinus asiaticus]|uniref:putative RNA-binding protein Luc7-like 1 isoform X2 n=1 Tax=Myxocyprinus asiaticus TaxID=70543 RepID=UPI0022225C20|nr:putative RNA-binding protein Luc7-like 1 isoform X2 [Myxocyprinus asiaticus]
MSAQAQMRALLDQLMGTSRDGDESRQRVKFTDERVCKSHLLNCCPNDILSGTRMDLGECSKIHDLALRADYEIASKERDLFFELDAVDHLESFIADCDRRTELAKKRLAETQEEISAEVAQKAEKVHELNEEIGKLLAKAEQLGAEGNVDEAQKILQEVEKVRIRKKDAEEEYRNSMPASSFQQQKLRVCEVCSAYLGLHDNDRRLADHFGGKLHLGFIQIREKLEQLKKTVQEKQEKRNQERLKRREEREKEEKMKKQTRSRSRERKSVSCCSVGLVLVIASAGANVPALRHERSGVLALKSAIDADGTDPAPDPAHGTAENSHTNLHGTVIASVTASAVHLSGDQTG